MRVYQPTRGGAWPDQPELAPASFRVRYELSFRSEDYGFRCALIVWRRR